MSLWREPPLVLLVEVDEADAALLTDLLDKLWPDRPVERACEWCHDYDLALHRMLGHAHDIYLLDYHLGERTGLELLEDARAAGFRGPVILLTGHGYHDTDVQVAKDRAFDFLPKVDLSPTLLERSIRYTIAYHHALTELAEMQRRLAESREDERIALARELHDGPLQELVGVRFLLSAMRTSVRDDDMVPRIATATDSLERATSALRALCGELRPPSLTPFGLASALRSHASALAVQHPTLDIQLHLSDDVRMLPESMRFALFRVYQNAIANVMQHAEARRLDIRLSLTTDTVTLEIRDDGRGFEVPDRWVDIARHGHYGLLGAAERAASLGAHLEVVSAPGEGATVRVVAARPAVEAPPDEVVEESKE